MNLQAKHPAMRTLAPDLLARFIGIVGQKHALTDPQTQQSYLVEMRGLYHGKTPVVLRPGSVEEVAAILKLANETKTAVVPQGGNTGLVGGQIPFTGEIVLSLTRLDKIREVDPESNTLTVEDGGTLQRARGCARPRSGAGRWPHPAQSQQVEKRQYRLRPEEPVHRRRRHARHHHRGGAAPGAQAPLN